MAIKVVAECDLCQSVMKIEPDEYEPMVWTWHGEQMAFDACEECEQNGTLENSTLVTLLDNSRAHEPRQVEFTCNYCKRSFDTSHGLNMHKARSHKPKGPKSDA